MRNHKVVKIMITGGHITPALAVIEELRRTHPDWQIVIVGRRYALEEKRVESEEVRLAKKYNLSFFPLTSGRLTRFFSYRTILSLLKIPIGIFQAFRIIISQRPIAVVSFGGYIALPVVVAAWFLKIPTLTHEQTRSPGLTNRIIARLTARVAVSYKEQISLFPSAKTVYTGLPMRRGIFERSKPPSWVSNTHVPLLYITGGSTGSTSLNTLIFPIIASLVKKYMIVHQTGRLSYESARAVRRALPKSFGSRYYICPYIDIPEYGWVLQNARIIIGRSGANTVGEVSAIGKIALWIPLPWSGGGEQWENAKFLSNAGSSLVLPQSSLTPEVLSAKIDWMLTHYKEYQNRALELAHTIMRDGAARVVRLIEELVLT